jgi:transposase
MQFRFRRRGTHTYVYLVQKGWRDGRVVNTAEVYLGTQEEVIRRLTSPTPDGLQGLEFLPYPFGVSSAILAADEELGFSKMVEGVTGSRAAAWALLAFVAGRAHEPVSKNGMEEWATRSLFHFLAGIPSLACRRYLDHMDLLTPEVVDTLTLRLGEKLVAQGHRPSLVFFDPTNFSTELDPDLDDPDRQIPRVGHPKDGNYQAKLVGLALATTEDHLPVFHRTYPGNENDARLFREIVGEMTTHLVKMGAAAEDLCFVFDKGNNSKPGFATIGAAKAHFVSSLKRNQAKDLLERPASAYRKLYVTEKKTEIRGFREKREVMGVKGVVVVAYNESGRKRQERDFEKAKARFLDGCKDIAKALSKPHRGRKSTQQSVSQRVGDLVPKKWRGVFRYRVGATLDQSFGKKELRFTVRAWVDEEAEERRRQGFGKTVIFTDRADWDDEKIVRTYFARSGQEEDFHVLKDVLLMPVMPIFHRRDGRVKVHAFLCVVGLLFYRWIQWKVEKVTKQRVPIGHLANVLRQIQVVALLKTEGEQVSVAKVVLQRLSEEQARVAGALGLARFVPK